MQNKVTWDVTPWGPLNFKDAESDLSDCDYDDHIDLGKDEYLYDAKVFVRCRGWGKHSCGNSVLIKPGRFRCVLCRLCTRFNPDNQRRFLVDDERAWRHFGENKKEEPEVMLEEGGELFSAVYAVYAVMCVAELLAKNGEYGFEQIPRSWDDERSRTFATDVEFEALTRLALIAERPGERWSRIIKAASALGGVTARPPTIPGKAGRSNIGYVHYSVVASFVRKLFRDKAIGTLEQLEQKDTRVWNKMNVDNFVELVERADDEVLATMCYALLAAASMAHIIEKKLCSPYLTWHKFRGGCWATGNFPTWQ